MQTALGAEPPCTQKPSLKKTKGSLRDFAPKGSGKKADPRRGWSEHLAEFFTEKAIALEFPREVQRQAAGLPTVPSANDCQGRLDLTKLPLCTIDDESAQDFDDAVHGQALENGDVRVTVAIADVSHYVRPGSALDQEARQRAFSLYYPEHCIPMLPHALSAGLCSLQPRVKRLCLAVRMRIDAQGKIVSTRLDRAVMHSHARLTYRQVQDWLDQTPAARAQAIPPAVADSLRVLVRVAKTLRRARQSKGSLELEMVQQKVRLDTGGQPKVIALVPRLETHRLIEDLMVATNEAMARLAVREKLSCLFRIHPSPQPEKLAQFITIAQSLGGVPPSLDRASLLAAFGSKALDGANPARGKNNGVPAKHSSEARSFAGQKGPWAPNRLLAQLHAHIAGRPVQAVLDPLLLRCMMQAQYSTANTGHFGLASDCYTHFTSPIRRYPDLMVHRILTGHMKGGQTQMLRRGKPSADDLADIAQFCSRRERDIVDSERQLNSMHEAWVMQSHVDEVDWGEVVGCGSFGVFVRLTSLHASGLLPIRRCSRRRLEFDAIRVRLLEKVTGQTLQLGDRLRVRIAGVHVAKGHVDLLPVRPATCLRELKEK
ncbi:MAG: RNB domain-containing ribonuclease [Myxococcota bacterium]